MSIKFVLLFLLLWRSVASQLDDLGFIYNGFQGVSMSMDGLAQITNDGLLMLVNTTKQQIGHAFYPHPVHFMNSSTGSVFSFSTTFVFSMFSELTTAGGPAMAFIIAPSRDFPGALPGAYVGLFNTTTIGNSSNHLIAVELDCLTNIEFNDINGNHVGIDINDLKSVSSAPASYFSDQENRYVNLTLFSGDAMQLWVDYSGAERLLNVTLAPIDVHKPTISLLSMNIDLSPIIVDPMFVGFSSATHSFDVTHYVMGWSFKMNGKAELTISQLPKLPHFGPKSTPKIFSVGLPVIGATLLLILIFIIYLIMKRKKRFAEVFEDWELEYRLHRFKYKDLYIATKGFKDKELLGVGGFGRVYRGVLPKSKVEVAVKSVSYNSRQGEREFVSEIVSIGKLRNRNIVTLLGYCRRKGEVLLVYDFMPNGSLDKVLFDHQTATKVTLNWSQRFRIIKSVAAALLYLHEECEKVVVHRDVKSSNVLLDKEMNGRLGDFGLARLYDHGTDPQTTHVVGTLGYLAPELCKTGKANNSVDVFAFGVFLLEVACGRRPIEPRALEECVVLVDWVNSCWSKGRILHTVDRKLRMDYDVQEMELVLRLGLLCSHSIPTARPHMRQVVRYLEGKVPQAELTLVGLSIITKDGSFITPEVSSDDTVNWYSNPVSGMSRSSSIAESLLSGGR